MFMIRKFEKVPEVISRGLFDCSKFYQIVRDYAAKLCGGEIMRFRTAHYSVGPEFEVQS